MKIEIINQQKIKRVSLKELSLFLKKAKSLFNISAKIKRKKIPAKVSVLLCDNFFIKKLNRKYFKKSGSTDVISFPLPDDFEPGYLGDVVVSVEKAVSVSKQIGCTWKKELVLYIVHGILHLTGFRDGNKKERATMEARQQKIMNKLCS